MANKKDALLLERYDAALRSMYNKDVRVEFPDNMFTHHLMYARAARQQDVRNLPDKRVAPDGKHYTPAMVMLQFIDNDSIVLVDEDVRDIRYSVVRGGVVISFDTYEIRITEV